MEARGVATVRRFSRVVTQRPGALNDEYLARPRPLGASRVLYEIGEAGADARAIRSRLGLDSGYLSRLLRRLEDERLVTVGRDTDDGRVRVIRLTEAGRAERAVLDRPQR
jgi:DNA-binding MarR family transcriptional regulator